jgi:hypothetical protein
MDVASEAASAAQLTGGDVLVLRSFTTSARAASICA